MSILCLAAISNAPTAPCLRRAARSVALPQEILDEVRQLNDLGYREITLLGQTVNAYGHDLETRQADGKRSTSPGCWNRLTTLTPVARAFYQPASRCISTSAD
jgi:hypothetical protein